MNGKSETGNRGMFSGEPSSTYTAALELAGGDHSAAIRLLELIADTNLTTQAVLRESFCAQNWESVASAAHRIAGSARMLECTGLLVLLMRLEAAARAAQSESAAEFFPLVMRELEALQRSIDIALGV